jgi:hypothetical protein
VTLHIAPWLLWTVGSVAWLVMGGWAVSAWDSMFMDGEPPGGVAGRVLWSVLVLALWPVLFVLVVIIAIISNLVSF